MTYEEKKKIADQFLIDCIGVGWNDLADINSLNDCETEQEIIEACEARLEENMYE